MITMLERVKAFEFEDPSRDIKMLPGKTHVNSKNGYLDEMATSCHMIKLWSSVHNYSCEAKSKQAKKGHTCTGQLCYLHSAYEKHSITTIIYNIRSRDHNYSASLFQ